MRTAIRVSGKNLGQLSLPSFCPRCFWVKLHCGHRLPFTIFPGIFSSLDSYSKRVSAGHFTKYGKLPAWFADVGSRAKPIDVPHWSKFSILDKETDVVLSGMPDELLEKEDRSLVICDYKTAKCSDGQDALWPLYQTQLNAYAHIASSIGLGTVAALFLVYYEPITEIGQADIRHLVRPDHFLMRFAPKILPVPLEPQTIPPLLVRAREIYDQPSPPRRRDDCEDCKRLDALLALFTPGSEHDEANVNRANAELPGSTGPGLVNQLGGIPSESSASTGMMPKTDLLSRIVASNPTLKIGTIADNGDLQFDVAFCEMGMTHAEFKTNPVARTKFFGNFLGELFVRRNITQFAPMVGHLDASEYARKVSRSVHTDFGLYVDESGLTFHLHASLIQSILTEDAVRIWDS